MKKSGFRAFYDVIGRNRGSDDVIKKIFAPSDVFSSKEHSCQVSSRLVEFWGNIGGGPIGPPCVLKPGFSRDKFS